jgi:tetratricopeptide (TPR) repeat protein
MRQKAKLIMKTNFTIFLLICMGLSTCVISNSFALENVVGYQLTDEYEQLKSEGDVFFTAGEYKKARLKYLACMEVPGYLSDNYAGNRASTCDKALELIRKGETLSGKEQLKEAIVPYEELVLYINQEDQNIKKELADIYSRLGDAAMKAKEIVIAKDYYQKSIRYFPSSQISNKLKEYDREKVASQVQTKPMSIQSPPEKAKSTPIPVQSIPKTNSTKKLVPVVASTTVGVVTLVMAQNLNKNWKTHLADLSASYNSGNTNEYKAQYFEASSYQKKKGLRNVLMMTSGLALAADVFFLVKMKSATLGSLEFKPSGLGMMARFTLD